MVDRLIQIAGRLVNFCHMDTPWEVALGAVAVAYITGEPEAGDVVLEGHYSGPEADAVWSILDEAASLDPCWEVRDGRRDGSTRR